MTKYKDTMSKLRPASRKKLKGLVKAAKKGKLPKSGIIKMRGKLKG